MSLFWAFVGSKDAFKKKSPFCGEGFFQFRQAKYRIEGVVSEFFACSFKRIVVSLA